MSIDTTHLVALSANLSGRVDETAERLRKAALQAGYHITSDDRIGEAELSALIGFSKGTLANRRREGKAPRHYTLPGKGHRVTYRLSDVAEWIEVHRH